MRTPLAALLLMGVALAGCTTTESTEAPPPPPTAADVAATTPQRWSNRLAWTTAARGGSAVRGEGYEHVIAADGRASAAPQSSATFDLDNLLARVRSIAAGSVTPAGSAPANALTNLLGRVNSPESPSRRADRLHQAWRRFCAGGQGMTSDDWTLVMNTSGPPTNTLDEKRRRGCGTLRGDFVDASEKARVQ